MSTTSGIILSARHEGFEKADCRGCGTRNFVFNRKRRLTWALRLQYRGHIDAIRSENYGFRPSACVFSLPRALCIWGLGLFMIHAMVLTFRALVNMSMAISWTTFVLVVVMGNGSEVIFPGNRFALIFCMFEDWFYTFQGYRSKVLRVSEGEARRV